MTSAVESVFAEAAQVLRPPPALTITEWAERERVLSPESSSEHGTLYRASRAPYQRAMQDAVLDPLVEEIVYMTSAQIGKSLCLENIGAYFCREDPCPIIWMWPSLERAKEWAGNELAAMIRDTPALRAIFPEGSRKNTSRTLFKRFPGGVLFVIGANSAVGLRAKRARIIIADEVDGYPVSAGSEGDPIDLVAKRQTTFWNKKRILSSTPTLKDASRIEGAYKFSNQQKYFVPCPDCGELQVLEWSRLHFDRSDVAGGAVEYCCRACAVCIPESKKAWMLEHGQWRALKSEITKVAGFWISELYSPFVSWRDMAERFVEASRDRSNPERLKAFFNLSLGETWEEQGEVVQADELMLRREQDWPPPALPVGVTVLTAGVDVQQDRIEVEVHGWGKGEERWAIEHQVFYGDPSRLVGGDASSPIPDQRLSPWQQLDEFLQKTYLHAWGVRLPIAATFVDSGYLATEVYGFTGPRSARRIYASKGVEGFGKPPLGKRSREHNRARVWLYPLAVDVIKDMLYRRLRILPPGAGSMHYSQHLHDAEYFAQLTSERLVRKYVRGYPKRFWELKVRGSRNEVLDLHVYSYAAFLSLSAQPEKMLAQLRAQLEQQAKDAKREREARDANQLPLIEVAPAVADPEADASGEAGSANLEATSGETGNSKLETAPLQSPAPADAPPPVAEEKNSEPRIVVRNNWVHNW